MQPGRETFTPENLRLGDILVISNAQGPKNNLEWESAFAPEEVRAVHDWVSGGGSLLLIADHFPMGGAAEKLSQAFGVEMTKGVTEDTVNCVPGEATSIVYSRENGLLVSHPITDGPSAEESIARVVTFTGQSISVPAKAVPFLQLGATARDFRPLAPKIVKSGNDRSDLRRRPSIRHERSRERQSQARAQHHALAVSIGMTGGADASWCAA